MSKWTLTIYYSEFFAQSEEAQAESEDNERLKAGIEIVRGIVAEKKRLFEQPLSQYVKSNVNLAVELVLCTKDEIKQINKEKREKDEVTDVLSFPNLDGILGAKLNKKSFPYDLDGDGNLMLGSIAVCLDRACEQAVEYNHSLLREVYYLVLHGMLHLLGYDHATEEDKLKMRAVEDSVLKQVDILRGDE